ncbi:MAG: cbb3-type cytochrome c oxidase subunit I [Thermoanaerobaculia bacterium]
MKAAAARLEKSAFNYWLLLALAAACLVASILTGVASGIVTAFPWPASRWMSLRALRPAHTLFALAWVIFGSAACVGLFAARNGVGRLWTSRLQIVFFNAFLFGSLVAAARGSYSGREYVTWPPAMSLPLIAGLVLVLANIVAAWKPIHGHSPEAAWLLSTGAVLLPAGLVEQYLYLLPRIAADPGRDLVVQWHALDTLIAAWCLLLYGVGVLLAPAGTRALRGGWLFALAMIGILLDFGHHNYPSPQPYLVKFVSFTASMLAAVSFLRHARAFRRTTRSSDSLPGLLRQIEIWTLFAVGSGILLAVPYVNLYLHGTYAIVGHTMGAMIGVNSLLLFAAGFAWSGFEARRRAMLVRGTSASLAVFCVALFGLGVGRGILRLDRDFAGWHELLRPFYVLIPISAIPLSVALLGLAVDLLRCCLRAMRALTADDLSDVGAALLPGPRAEDAEAVTPR